MKEIIKTLPTRLSARSRYYGENLSRRKKEQSLFLSTTGMSSESRKVSHTFQKKIVSQSLLKLIFIFSQLRSITSKNIWAAPPFIVALSWLAPPAKPLGFSFFVIWAHMCSFPPKLTCSRVCWRPSVKSFHLCGICRHRPSAKLLGAVMLLACSDLYLLKWEGTQGINRRLQSRGCRGAGGGRCMAGPSFCLCYPASTPSPNLLPVYALPVRAVLGQ